MFFIAFNRNLSTEDNAPQCLANGEDLYRPNRQTNRYEWTIIQDWSDAEKAQQDIGNNDRIEAHGFVDS